VLNGLPLRDHQVLATIGAALACLGGIAWYMATRKHTTDEELERMRRQDLVLGGRIIDGTVLDVSELDAYESGRPEGMQLILYKYEIAGVSYECSQDITHLKDLIHITDIRVGFPCSVRYNTHQPENSIVIAENWIGLRDTANSVPVRRSNPRRRWSAPVS
jgi:hypothetical protein